MVLRRLYAPWRRLRGGDLGELVHSGAGGVAFMEQVEKENEVKCEEKMKLSARKGDRRHGVRQSAALRACACNLVEAKKVFSVVRLSVLDRREQRVSAGRCVEERLGVVRCYQW
jgi:hypothetical protein